jgi:hypothetical protein
MAAHVTIINKWVKYNLFIGLYNNNSKYKLREKNQSITSNEKLFLSSAYLVGGR